MSSTKKNSAIILPWSLNHDSRAQRTLKVLAEFTNVDLFHIPNQSEKDIVWDFGSNVSIVPLQKPVRSFINKIYSNTFFYKVYDYFIDEVLLRKKKYDIIYIHDLLAGNIGLKLQKEFNARLIYDVHDLYLETINQQFPVKQNGEPRSKYKPAINLMKYFGTLLEKKIIKNSSLIFTVNESCKEYLVEVYKRNDIKYFHNYPELSACPENRHLLSKKLNLSSELNFSVYIGKLNHGRHLESIVRSALFLSDKNVLIVIGDGNLKENLIQISTHDGTLNKKVFFIDHLPYKNLFETIAEAKLGIMLLDPINKSKEYAFANKITEYMLCGIPPLLSNHKEHQKMMSYKEVGYIISDYSPQAIAGKINDIYKNETDRLQRSRLSRLAYEEKYNWSQEVESLRLEIKRII